jgi:hypothetical protein
MKSYLARYLYFAFINLMTLPIIFLGLSALLTEKGTALVVTCRASAHRERKKAR